MQTRALLDLHVDINDLSDYACTLAIHMTNIILTTCIDEERYASGPHRLRQSARPPGPRARPIRASQQPPTTPGASSRARGRQGTAQRHKVRAQRSRKIARTGQVTGAGCAAAGLLGLIGLAKNETTPRDRSRGCRNGSPGGNSNLRDCIRSECITSAMRRRARVRANRHPPVLKTPHLPLGQQEHDQKS